MKNIIKNLKLRWSLWRAGIIRVNDVVMTGGFRRFSFHNKGKTLRIYAGPYAQRPDQCVYGVCLDANMAREFDHDYFMDWPDFGIPQMKDLDETVVHVMNILKQDRAVYVGCLGGIGRTGTFLACLVKYAGKPDAVQFVRGSYLKGAVETKAQEAFVDAYPHG